MPSETTIRRLLILFPLVALSACAPVGPNHEIPSMTLPASFSQGGVKWKRQSPDTLPKPQAWWKWFGDSTLNSLVERSLDRNQDIAASAARLRQAREMSTIARAQFFPDINLGATGDRTKSRMRGPFTGSFQSNTFAVPVDMSYELDMWGKVRRQVESATASEGAAQEMHNALRLSIAGEVAQTYWALRAVDVDRGVLDHTLVIRRKALDLLTKSKNAGTISGLDLARAETEVATAEADRIKLDQTRVDLVNSLAVLAGSVATGSSVSERADLPKPPSIPGSIPSELLRQRPDIRAAERNVAAANAKIGVATAAFYPSFSIRSSGGLDAASMSDLFQASSLVWSLGANALTPLNYGLLKAQRKAAVAAHDAASAEYRQTVLEAIREVENALQGSTILVRRQVAQEQALVAAQKTFDLSVKRYKSGLVSFLDVVDAERTRLETERAANAIRAERLAISVSLIKSIGGEW